MDDEEEAMNSVGVDYTSALASSSASSKPTVAIDLSFSGNDPVWDDRELINSFDDAMAQFRVRTRYLGAHLFSSVLKPPSG